MVSDSSWLLGVAVKLKDHAAEAGGVSALAILIRFNLSVSDGMERSLRSLLL